VGGVQGAGVGPGRTGDFLALTLALTVGLQGQRSPSLRDRDNASNALKFQQLGRRVSEGTRTPDVLSHSCVVRSAGRVGGVVKSADYARYSVGGNPRFASKGVDPAPVVAKAYSLFIDLPLSAIGDTLTLPITIPATLKRQSDAEPSDQLKVTYDESEPKKTSYPVIVGNTDNKSR
jgi:hypothetical protein